MGKKGAPGYKLSKQLEQVELYYKSQARICL